MGHLRLLESDQKVDKEAMVERFILKILIVATLAFGVAISEQSASAAEHKNERRSEKIDPIKVEKEKVPEKKKEQQETPAQTKAPTLPPILGVEIITGPIVIKDGLPDIILTGKIVDSVITGARGSENGSKNGVGTKAAGSDSATLLEFQVEKQAIMAQGSPQPSYPSLLRDSGVQGEVFAQFVVDTIGRVDVSTLKILKSTHKAFEDAVKKDLPRMRFLPAEVGGKKVKQLVQLPFAFSFKHD